MNILGKLHIIVDRLKNKALIDNILITRKCLFKLDKEKLAGIVNDIKSDESFTVSRRGDHV